MLANFNKMCYNVRVDYFRRGEVPRSIVNRCVFRKGEFVLRKRCIMDLRKTAYEWLIAKLGGGEKGKQRFLVLVPMGSVLLGVVTILLPLVVIKVVWERFFGSLPFSFAEGLLAYVGFRLLRMDLTLTHIGNLLVKFAGLPFVLSLAWAQVLPLFWAARPAMDFEQVWLGYIGIYAVATVLSQVLNPKQVL